jgi:hypothetical protein
MANINVIAKAAPQALLGRIAATRSYAMWVW